MVQDASTVDTFMTTNAYLCHAVLGTLCRSRRKIGGSSLSIVDLCGVSKYIEDVIGTDCLCPFPLISYLLHT